MEYQLQIKNQKISKMVFDIWYKILAFYSSSYKQIAPETTGGAFIKEFYTTVEPLQPKSTDDIKKLLSVWDNHRKKFMEIFKEFDVFICPVTEKAGYLHESEKKFNEIRHAFALNVIGLPSLAIGGIVEAKEEGFEGLPVGIQLFSNFYREDVILSLGKLIEKRREITKPKHLL